MAENLTPKKRVNRDKPDFATKQRMFGLLAIDGGPPLSMTAGPATSAGLFFYYSNCPALMLENCPLIKYLPYSYCFRKNIKSYK